MAATNRNLNDLAKAGLFREDLYYRIRVIHFVLPTLRNRREGYTSPRESSRDETQPSTGEGRYWSLRGGYGKIDEIRFPR